MRLSIYDRFVVGVVRPKGGWSKGRPIAFIEEADRCLPLFDLLIPNDLNDEGLVRFVSGRFTSFASPGRRIVNLDDTGHRAQASHDQGTRPRGPAHPAPADLRH
jgi:hypothetical protein